MIRVRAEVVKNIRIVTERRLNPFLTSFFN